MIAKKQVTNEAYIRCDTSHEIGGGHMIRCLALAEQLREAGLTAHFLCKDHLGSLHPLARPNGFDVTVLPPNLEQSEDAEFCAEIIGKTPNSLIIVDNYFLDSVWEQKFYPEHFVMVIDDLANRRHLCHALLDVNYEKAGENRYRDLVPTDCVKLLGPSHSLLRKEFRNLKLLPLEQRQGCLVFFGSGDATGESLKFVRALRDNERVQDLHFHLLLSKAQKFLPAVQKEGQMANLTQHVEPASVASLMGQCKIYFGSGGTITWERMACGLPGLIVAVADNQISSSQQLADDGFQTFLGPVGKIQMNEALALCKSFVKDSAKLVSYSNKGLHLVRPFNPQSLLDILH